MLRFGLGAALPGTVVVGKDGRIGKVISGVVNQADLKKQIEAMHAYASTSAEPAKNNQQITASRKPAQGSSVPS